MMIRNRLKFNIQAIAIAIGAAILYTTASYAGVEIVLIGDATQEQPLDIGIERSLTNVGATNFGYGYSLTISDNGFKQISETQGSQSATAFIGRKVQMDNNAIFTVDGALDSKGFSGTISAQFGKPVINTCSGKYSTAFVSMTEK